MIEKDVLGTRQRTQSDKLNTLQETFWELFETEEAMSRDEWIYLFKKLLHLQTVELYPDAFLDGYNIIHSNTTEISQGAYIVLMNNLYTEFIKNCHPDKMSLKEMADYLVDTETKTYKEGVRAGVVYAVRTLQ